MLANFETILDQKIVDQRKFLDLISLATETLFIIGAVGYTSMFFDKDF